MGSHWPHGNDGALLITTGQTVNITDGSTKDYSSIQIDSGGTLNIVYSTGAWTKIGCAGTCIINGTVTARGNSNYAGNTFSSTDPNGFAMSYTVATMVGGNGGSGTLGQNPVPTAGVGGTGGGAYYDGRCAGGGGGHGNDGLGIYFLVKGNLSGTGTINVSGSAGSNGGAAGNYCVVDCGWVGAGGGGGGGGGSGGKILIRALGGTSGWSPTTNVAAGVGGNGGAQGLGWVDGVNTSYVCDKICVWSPCAPTGGGGNGAAGSAGSTGSYVLQTS